MRRYCRDCGLAWGDCRCVPCTADECRAVATDKCFECDVPICEGHSRGEYGSSLAWCPRCQPRRFGYIPCENPAPERTCKTKTFAPELLHDCADCQRSLCAACVVVTPEPNTIFQGIYRCPGCQAQAEQPSAA